jgi:hypothetical protein
MKYLTHCLSCERRKELTEKAFRSFLTETLKARLEAKLKEAGIVHVKITFHDNCPDCRGAQGQSKITLSSAKGKVH